MKNKIGRTLFIFSDINGRVKDLDNGSYPLSILLNNLLNEVYEGKKIKFINLYFGDTFYYEKQPNIELDHVHHYGGHLHYQGLINYKSFSLLKKKEQWQWLWKKAYEYLQMTAQKIKNDDLFQAVEYAYQKGITLDLVADYPILEKEVSLFNKEMTASLWINFKESHMYSKFILEYKDQVLFEKEIDKARNGVEFFLEMYKKIEVKENNIIIKGHYDVDYLPLTIEISENILMK